MTKVMVVVRQRGVAVINRAAWMADSDTIDDDSGHFMRDCIYLTS